MDKFRRKSGINQDLTISVDNKTYNETYQAESEPGTAGSADEYEGECGWNLALTCNFSNVISATRVKILFYNVIFAQKWYFCN